MTQMLANQLRDLTDVQIAHLWSILNVVDAVRGGDIMRFI